MKIISAWIEDEDGCYAMVAAVDEDHHDPAYFEAGVEDAELSYGAAARRLEFDIPDSEIASLFFRSTDAE